MRKQNDCLMLDARIIASASAVGKKESNGPLGELFDLRDPTDRFGMSTWEGAESEMQRFALNTALAKAGLRDDDIGALFAGDLLNQCVGSAYGLLTFNIPYFGLYGACSTCAESLLLSSIAVTHGVFEHCCAVTSSHYCSAERQYRTPLEYGSQRPPTAQWTVTGSGAFVLEKASKRKPSAPFARIQRGMAGIAIDKGINDANNMGAAMAPAAESTLTRFFAQTHTSPQDYDLIVTGDLGFEGGEILCDLMRAAKLPIADRYADCGQMIYDRDAQDVHGGGSGCGCSAVVLASHLLPQIARGELGKILFLATGAMMSPDMIKQGQNIPAVAHLLEIAHCAGNETRSFYGG